MLCLEMKILASKNGRMSSSEDIKREVDKEESITAFLKVISFLINISLIITECFLLTHVIQLVG